MEELKNELLQRKEIITEISSDSTPKTEEALKKVSDFFNVPEDRIVIKKIEGRFGMHSFLIKAYIYDSVDIMNKIERMKKEKISDTGVKVK